MQSDRSNTTAWSVMDATSGTSLDVIIDGDVIELSMIEDDEFAMVIHMTATRDQVRRLANWILQNV